MTADASLAGQQHFTPRLPAGCVVPVVEFAQAVISGRRSTVFECEELRFLSLHKL